MTETCSEKMMELQCMLNKLNSSEENCTSLGLRDQHEIEEPLK